MILERLNIY